MIIFYLKFLKRTKKKKKNCHQIGHVLHVYMITGLNNSLYNRLFDIFDDSKLDSTNFDGA